jgi:aldehyde dehydrogenase (NAD+)
MSSELVKSLVPALPEGGDLEVRSPIDGALLARLTMDTPAQVDEKIARAHAAFTIWRDVPAPRRGELIRLLGEKLREKKEPLAQLVTLECGKIITEGRGEVQEMIDICDFAVGLSRQLHGLTIASERPEHVMQENWLPLGTVGIISAFNFPVAVWAWNFALAIVCGDPCLWKPSEKTPLTALACQAIFEEALREFGDAPEGLSQVIIGDRRQGSQMVEDPRVALVSATGSSRMGREVGPVVAGRFGRCLLELGGNNAVIVTPSADLSIALPSLLFGAVGTAGQRCTSTRRIIVHRSVEEELWSKLTTAYDSLTSKIGDPLRPETLIGPLIDQQAFENMERKLASLGGAAVHGGGRILADQWPDAWYAKPALVRLERQIEPVMEEVFAPLAYLIPYDDIEEAFAIHNAVPQGLSSAIMTTDVREAELFKRRSDCGIANVNIGTSGAEIGGAFGGEKETGGGRESGSDSWKAYMRRQTSTTYYGHTAPALAQGVQFEA